MMRWLVRSFFAVIIILLLLFILLVSPLGLKWGVDIVKHYLPGKLYFQKISGNLFGPINITHMRYIDQGFEIKIAEGHLSWRLPMLLFGDLDIADLRLNKISMTGKVPSRKTSSKASPLQLPFGLQIEKANINNFVYNKLPFTIAHIGIHQLKLTKRHIKGNITVNINKPYPIYNQITLHGRLSDYEFNWHARFIKNQLTLSGHGNTTSASAKLNGAINGNIHVNWYPFLKWNIDITSRHFNLKQIGGNFPHLIDANIKTDGNWKNKYPAFNVNAHIQIPGANIKLVGKHINTWNLHWQADIHDLSALYKPFKGSINASGTLTGQNQNPLISAKFVANKIMMDNLDIQQIEGKTHVDLGFNQPSQLHLSAKHIVYNDIPIKKLIATFKAAKHLSTIQSTISFIKNHREKITVSTQLQGKLINSRWQGFLNKATVNANTHGRWNLTKPVRLILSPSIIDLNKACWHSNNGRICFNAKWTKPNIQSHMTINLSDLKLLETFIPYISEPKGRILGEMAIGGTTTSPNITGNLSLKNGVVDIPMIKIALKNVNMKAHMADKKMQYTISALSDRRPITITGVSQFQTGKFITTLHLKANDVLVSNTAEYTIFASPDLHIRAIGHNIILTGTITIPKADIKPSDFSSTVSLPDDTIIITARKKFIAKPWSYILNIHIILGKQVMIDSHGLKAKARGNVRITQTKTEIMPIASGQISLLNATFEAEGKQLTVSPGSKIYYMHDPLKNPHLDFRAYRQVTVTSADTPFGPSSTQVGISVKGTLQKPIVSLFSNPVSLSQANIISYLLFGTPATGGSSKSNLSLLLQAITSLRLGSKGPSSGISKIKQSLGITELGVQEQTYIDALGTPLGFDQSSFVIGTYITPKIYLRYSHGILTPVNIYQVRYLINKNWSIQAETTSGNVSPGVSLGSGIDILYTIGRKKFPW